MARDMFRNTQSTLSSLDCEAARDGSVWETTMSHASKLWRVWYEDGDWHLISAFRIVIASSANRKCLGFSWAVVPTPESARGTAMGDKVSGERDLCSWRQNRSPGWTKDIGYALQDEVSRHHFDLKNRGSKPDSPNWHACTCGEWRATGLGSILTSLTTYARRLSPFVPCQTPHRTKFSAS